MLDLGVELRGKDFALDALHGSNRAHVGAGGNGKALGHLGHGVAVAHPHGLLHGRRVKELGAGRARDGSATILAHLGVADLAAERHSRDLVAVAKAQDGKAQVKDDRIDGGSVLGIHRSRAAGKDERRGVHLANLVGRDVAGDNLGIHVEVADATGNELTVLRTKVEYEDLCGSILIHGFPLLLAGSRCPPARINENNFHSVHVIWGFSSLGAISARQTHDLDPYLPAIEALPNVTDDVIRLNIHRPVPQYCRTTPPLRRQNDRNTSMKRILLIATGGTIASTEDGNGLSPALTGEELAQSVPEILGLCKLDVVQPMNIDSTNMRPSDWMRIRDVIVEGYADHDGFVVLHGTDTMSYTAAALSYLIQDSPKPIVLTGSQKPMGNPFTDAKLNLYQSLLYALDEHSHDVSIVFGGVAIAGTRARKQRTMSFNAFISVNYPPIAYIRNDRIVRNGLHGTHQNENPVRFYDSIDPRVFVLKLTPGVNPGILDALADSYDAVILETFGIGGIPEFGESGESFQEAIFRWVDSGRTVVMTTQVPEEGLDLGVYEVGRAYADHPGILRGDDMTTETLVAKTMWALGQSRDAAEIQRLFYSQVNHDRIPMA